MLRTILIVDDDKLNRIILKNILSAGYLLLEAENGKDALDVLNKNYADISAVLLDIVMPVMDGYDVLSAMRSDSRFSQIPVMITTGDSETGTEVKALSLGANDFATKPYNPDIIKRRLWNLIDLRENAALVNAAKTDALTGLYSRAYFFDIAAEMIEKQEPGFYIMSCFDIDNFKVINDQYGTEKGDGVLKCTADELKKCFAPVGGICCRITADQFAVLYPAVFLNTAVTKKIQDTVAARTGLMQPVMFTIGRYSIDDVTLTPSAMYDRAAMAMESVKNRYDTKTAFYDESMRTRILQEQKITGEMNSALAGNCFEVWFQPQYNHAAGIMTGAEALVRWRHPQQGLVPPGEFIPIFEKNGFIYELDKYVWTESCKYLRKWIDRGISPLPVSVNISRYDLFKPDLLAVLTGLIETYRVPVELLRLEITETAFSKSAEQIIGIVREFVSRGFIVEIDDFGSGYSSLNTLKNVPAQVLKLDMRFLEGGGDSERGGNIIESVIRMAKWIDMAVIAEGVETISQADFLKSIGCCHIQGYLYAKPLPAAEYETLLEKKDYRAPQLVPQSVENIIRGSFWDPDSIDTIIFNSYVGGAGVFEYCDGRLELIRANDKYARVIGAAGMTIEDALKTNWADHLDAKNRAIFDRAVKYSLETKDEVTKEYVLQNLPGGSGEIYLRSTLRVIAAAGERLLIYCINENITVQRKAEQKETEALEQLSLIMNNINGGVTAVTVDDKQSVNFIYANDQYYAMIGYTKEQLEKEHIRVFDLIHPDDRESVIRQTAAASKTLQPFSCVYRITRGDGSIKWIRSNISVTVPGTFGKPVQIAVANDITEYRRTEESNRIYDAEMKLAMSQMGKMICEYNPATMTILLPKSYAEWYGVPTTLENFPYCIYEQDYIGEPYKEKYFEFYESILRGDKKGTFESHNRRKDGSWHWENYEFINLFGDSEKPVKTIIFVEDITAQKELRLRYNHELQLRHELIKDSIIYYEINLSTGMINEYISKLADVPGMTPGSYINEHLRSDILKNIAESDRDLVCNTIFSDALRESFKQRKTSVRVEYRRNLYNKEPKWVQATASIMRHPDTDDIVAFLHILDIDMKKKNGLALEKILDKEIDSVKILNIKTKQAHFAKTEAHSNVIENNSSFDYEDHVAKFIDTEITEEYKESCRNFFRIENLVRALNNAPSAMTTYEVKTGDGKTRRKRGLVFYLDDSKNDIVLSRCDITDLYEEEQKQKQALQKAIDIANKANNAKSDFLSRMSHDIRTPLNAVLAFSSPDLTDGISAKELRTNLKKIHAAGNYLLGIINDVLDMSKIEQKKVTLRPVPYSFSEFTKTLNIVIVELCRSKNITFVLDARNVKTETLLVDKVRFNQIFMNLLSNAVKFTPEGGKIELLIEDIGIPDHDTVKKRFTVRDNGIGMTKDFIPHAFESFEQEYRKDISDKVQGTGLGLSIVKQLVDLMNGTICLESEINKGTTFILELPLKTAGTLITADENARTKKRSLRGLKVLLCEDNAINTEIAVHLLALKNCVVDCAENGKEGCEKFMASPVNYYDVILMDIRMPVMNGIEATKLIRASGRDDAKTVTIFAMTADTFSEDEAICRNTGMDGHISKPIDAKIFFERLRSLQKKPDSETKL